MEASDREAVVASRSEKKRVAELVSRRVRDRLKGLSGKGVNIDADSKAVKAWRNRLKTKR